MNGDSITEASSMYLDVVRSPNLSIDWKIHLFPRILESFIFCPKFAENKTLDLLKHLSSKISNDLLPVMFSNDQATNKALKSKKTVIFRFFEMINFLAKLMTQYQTYSDRKIAKGIKEASSGIDQRDGIEKLFVDIRKTCKLVFSVILDTQKENNFSKQKSSIIEKLIERILLDDDVTLLIPMAKKSFLKLSRMENDGFIELENMIFYQE